jgi:hypothetical protein
VLCFHEQETRAESVAGDLSTTAVVDWTRMLLFAEGLFEADSFLGEISPESWTFGQWGINTEK